MNIVKSMRRSSFWSAAFTSAACLAGAAQASAAVGPRSTTVSYRDLNLSTIEGATVLYQRLKHAADWVCDERGTALERYRIWQSCYRVAIADAIAKVSSPLVTQLHDGKNKEASVTAMNIAK
jgi:UrcA family protein